MQDDQNNSNEIMDEMHPSKDMDLSAIQDAITTMLSAFGENPMRKGLLRTPERVARMYTELLSGYMVDPNKIVNDALFEVTYDEMVIVRDIEFYSMCEHHLLPFMGRAHVAYLPSGRVIGLSKIPRIVDVFAHRLQVQERMTRQIADFINDALMPKGVAVVVEDHVREAEKHIEHNRVFEALKNLTFHSKLVILSVYTLSKAEIQKAITGEIYEVYSEICGEVGIVPLTQRRLGSLINELDSMGLLNAKVTSMGRYGRTKRIKLEIARGPIKDVFANDGRLGRLVDYVPNCLSKCANNAH